LLNYDKSSEQPIHPQMTKNDFRIGLAFYTAAGKWRCTDVGSRVIVAICRDGHNPVALKPFGSL
jgi:hypothetical protein